MSEFDTRKSRDVLQILHSTSYILIELLCRASVVLLTYDPSTGIKFTAGLPLSMVRGCSDGPRISSTSDSSSISSALFQRAGQSIELVAPLSEQFSRSSIGFVQNSRNFLIDEPGRVFAELALFVNLLAQEGMLLARAIGHRSDLLAHAPVGDHAAGQARDLLQVASAPALYSSKISFSAARPPSTITSRRAARSRRYSGGLLPAAVA